MTFTKCSGQNGFLVQTTITSDNIWDDIVDKSSDFANIVFEYVIEPTGALITSIARGGGPVKPINPTLSNEKTAFDFTNWMSKLDDSTLITSLSIPGTHDSLTFNYDFSIDTLPYVEAFVLT